MFDSNLFMDGCKDVVISFGDNLQFTGKDAYVTRIDISIPSVNQEIEMTIEKAPEPIKISMELMVSPEKFMSESWDCEAKATPIRRKKVKDCSIRELLFAIRYKLSDGKK